MYKYIFFLLFSIFYLTTAMEQQKAPYFTNSSVDTAHIHSYIRHNVPVPTGLMAKLPPTSFKLAYQHNQKLDMKQKSNRKSRFSTAF